MYKVKIKIYQSEWEDAPRCSIGEGVEGAECEADVPLAGRDGVPDVDGADRFDLKIIIIFFLNSFFNHGQDEARRDVLITLFWKLDYFVK